jgi:3-methyladenine DNA glycosylase AlkD
MASKRLPQFVADARLRLLSFSNEEKAMSKSKYFKHVAKFYGVSTPDIEKTYTLVLQNRFMTSCDSIELASVLLSDEFHEMKQLGVYSLFKAKKVIFSALESSQATVSVVEAAFDAGNAADWATTDTLSTRVLAEGIRKHGTPIANRVSEWRSSPIIWKRRSSAVTFVKLADPKLGYNDLIFSICREALLSSERFVQLGCGWVLREVSVHSRAATTAFIRANIDSISREGLRYALEKYDAAGKTALMNFVSSVTKDASSPVMAVAVSGTKRKRSAVVSVGMKPSA